MNDFKASGTNLDEQDSLIGLVSLMRMAVAGVDLAPVGTQLIERASATPEVADANALMDLSYVLQLRGNRDLALEVQAQALAIRRIYFPPTGRKFSDRENASLHLLVIMGPGDLMSNSPIEFLLNDADIALDIVYVTLDQDMPNPLPRHDLIFVAIAESEQNKPLLSKVQSQLSFYHQSVINQPGRIALLSRDSQCQLLGVLDGVDMPLSVKVGRQVLERVAGGVLAISSVVSDADYPVIVRPVDSHAGKGLDKLDNVEAIVKYLRATDCSEFYVSRFVDYRSKDGMYRKVRIVLIEGIPYVCHEAIFENWMIHYLNAGMDASSWKRDEEARFMAEFDTSFAVSHAGAFKGIYERIGLDYLGIDCAETSEGKLLIFEVDSCMIVHALDPVDIFPYKQPQMRKIFDAFYRMLVHAVQRARSSPV